jgi:UPF0755 protein
MHNIKRRKLKKILVIGFIFIVFSGAVGSFIMYRIIFAPNLNIDEHTHFYISTGSSFSDVVDILDEQELLQNKKTFIWLANKKNYTNHVRPGRYLLNASMGNNALINLLRSGRQDPINITFNNIRTKDQLAGEITRYLEADSLSMIKLMNDQEYLKDFGVSKETVMLLFIPNTYEFYWNTSAIQIFNRMYREYQRFWDDHRLARANTTGFTPEEVMIIASIVQSETTRTDEMSRIAGVYINRLQRNMLLQADPTVVFANGDFTITRVLHRHLAVDSPYNTYLYPGLPPGPISLPEPLVVDKVLEYEHHDFLYFCARDDFSGYHAFAKTYNEHLANARRYHRALNARQRQQ